MRSKAFTRGTDPQPIMSNTEITIHWSTLRVQQIDLPVPTTLTDVKRFAELLNWRKGRKPAHTEIFDFASGAFVESPRDVDWTGFPMNQAHQELMDQELRAAALRFRMGVRPTSSVRITVL